MKLGGGREWYTAAELAAHGLPGLSKAKRKINERASAELWALRTNSDSEPLARPSAKRGGGLEYHVDVLPAAARAALAKLGVAAIARVSDRPESGAAAMWRAFDAASSTSKAAAKRRVGVVAMVESFQAAGMTKSAAGAAAAKRGACSGATIWNWLELVRGVEAADRLAALTPRSGGGGSDAPIDPQVWQVFLSDYLRPEQPTLTSAYRRATSFAGSIGVAVPCERSFRRRLEREDPRMVILQRAGADALRQTLPPTQRTVRDLHAMEALNIDGHKFDVFVRWPDGRVGRPMMVALQDIYSRKFVAWRIDESENQLVTRTVFADLFRDWGLPKACVLDNGRAFASKGITGGAKTRFRFKVKEFEADGVLTALGITTHFTMPYRGQSKPIERAFRDLCDTIAKHPACAGAYTGNRPDAKPENYGSKAIPIETFRALVHAGMAEHNGREGRRTEIANGRSFDQAFAESYAVSPIGKATPEQLRLALLTAEDRRCDKTTSVITLEGNRYWAQELGAHAGELLSVRFDPDNLHGEIHVYDRQGRFIVTAPAIAAVGFFDKAGARERARLERDVKRRTRELAIAQNLIAAADLAAMLPDHIDETPAPVPTVLRPVRRGGATAAMRAVRADEEAAQGATIDRMMSGLRTLRAVK